MFTASKDKQHVVLKIDEVLSALEMDSLITDLIVVRSQMLPAEEYPALNNERRRGINKNLGRERH